MTRNKTFTFQTHEVQPEHMKPAYLLQHILLSLQLFTKS